MPSCSLLQIVVADRFKDLRYRVQQTIELLIADSGEVNDARNYGYDRDARQCFHRVPPFI